MCDKVQKVGAKLKILKVLPTKRGAYKGNNQPTFKYRNIMIFK